MNGVAVVGVGAIGTVLAARLLAAGRDVTCCVRRPFDELRLDAPDGAIALGARVVTDPAAVTPASWVLLATKAHQTDGAAAWLAALVDDETRVAVLQNGVEHAARVSRWVPRRRVVPVVVQCPAERVAPGHAVQRGGARLVVAADSEGRRFAALLSGTGIDCELSDDFVTAAWDKLCANAVGGALAALSAKPLPEVAHPAKASIARALALECASVARAEGARLSDAAALAVAARIAGATQGGAPSILRDRLRGEPLEWDARNGVVVRLGARHGVPTPVSARACELLADAYRAGGRDLLDDLALAITPP